jgi:hypothetical protein
MHSIPGVRVQDSSEGVPDRDVATDTPLSSFSLSSFLLAGRLQLDPARRRETRNTCYSRIAVTFGWNPTGPRYKKHYCERCSLSVTSFVQAAQRDLHGDRPRQNRYVTRSTAWTSAVPACAHKQCGCSLMTSRQLITTNTSEWAGKCS